MYTLTRDGVVILRNVDYHVIMQYIHRHHSYSLSHALKWEGYAITENRVTNDAE